MRVELLAKLYFFRALRLEGTEAFLDAQESFCQERLEQLRRRVARGPHDEFAQLVSDFRRHRIQATLDWLRTLVRG
jgi:hypothetical protein